ncbi:sensor histidine kinase [Paracraurococcus lichenis]|uniref:histidine kinase n=1 Tax=Paracraurococcus lichenis TaxID=3064888 RepID=A0ABT9EAS6_9PROT|nr:HWE histidine kinase domain-containing protein [Paracraurococcus sp. LOR1-02]MDO9713308.1 HWE histidine kinase domain-containing protein [Paracraurococcus sp. LOR1-02]
MTALPVATPVAPEAGACRVLHLEDSLIDAELVAAQLARAGVACAITHVETRAAYSAALAGGSFDLVLADYALPDFDGLSALAMARELAPDTPFIFVSGTLGEEAAVDAVKQGATDYVVKQRLGRLPIAVERALAEARAHAERREAMAALAESEDLHRLIVESAEEYAIFTTDLDGVVTTWNAGAERILGYAAAEILGRSAEVVFTPEDRAAGCLAEEMRSALTKGCGDDERWHLRKGGTRFWASGLTMPLRDRAGAVRGFLKILRDRTERRRAEERRALLVAELNHRVKNTLATVQSLAQQTLKSEPEPRAFAATFQGRLRALARAHDLLTREEWAGATLADVARAALAPWLDGKGGGGRLGLDGPELMLAPRQALGLSMALHELATNAAKHGALSEPGGRVSLAWRRAGPAATVEWTEEGGPPVRPPERRGFGSRLLGRALAAELGGSVELDFAPGGVRCAVRLPLVADTAPASAGHGGEPGTNRDPGPCGMLPEAGRP